MKLAVPEIGTRTESLDTETGIWLRHYRRRRSGPNLARLNLIDITPDPGFAGFNGTHQRVFGSMEMFGGVLVLRRVTAGRVPANETHAQVNPRVAGFDAVFANVLVRFCNLNFFQVRAFCRHRLPPKKILNFGSSDLSHVTKGHNHSQEPNLSRTMFMEVFIRVSARLSLLRVDHRVHNSGGAAVLGRLGIGWR
jgi:hypothetical protein